MKNIIKLALIILTLSCCICGCASNEGQEHGESGGTEGSSQAFVLKAIVSTVGEKIEVEIIESDYAFGTYLVITSDNTDFIGKDGSKINKSDLKSGDTVEITYNGQTMLSLPPQIVAHKIKVV